MQQSGSVEILSDLLYQAMFTVTKNGYSPKEVDAFIEELKDECRIWNRNYLELQRELQEIKEGTQNGRDAGPKTGD